jgi:hypothetical protein
MTSRARLFIALARPAVLVLLAMFCSMGLAASGQGDQLDRLLPALIVVMAFLVFSVAVNDLADAAIDRVNLPGHAARALVAGHTDVPGNGRRRYWYRCCRPGRERNPALAGGVSSAGPTLIKPGDHDMGPGPRRARTSTATAPFSRTNNGLRSISTISG